jgi:hypothetical protein
VAAAAHILKRNMGAQEIMAFVAKEYKVYYEFGPQDPGCDPAAVNARRDEMVRKLLDLYRGALEESCMYASGAILFYFVCVRVWREGGGGGGNSPGVS